MRDVLTNPEQGDTRRFYSDDLSKPVGFQQDSFPAGYWPQVAGFRFEPYTGDFASGKYDPRRLVVRLDRYEIARDEFLTHQAGETLIEVLVFDGGGGGNDGVYTIGGCRIFYVVTRSDAGFAIEWRGAID
jgi:hypothetical protein